MEELIEAQSTEEFCKQVHHSLEMGENMKFDDNPDTEEFEKKKYMGNTEP